MFAPLKLPASVVMMLATAWVVQQPAIPEAPDDKLDEGLGQPREFYPIFVRMEDQLFRHGGDYEAFCRENEGAKRSAVRERVTRMLREKADRSWDRLKDRVADLESSGQVKDVTRYWIVNGFACDATGAACKALADDAGVSFVYKQRGPDQVRQHGKRGTASAVVAGGDLKSVEDLPGPQRERLLARLKEQGIDPATVRVRIGNSVPPPSAADQTRLLQELAERSHSDAEQEFSTDGLEIPWNLKLIQADQAWTQEGVVGRGAIVALNDGGIVDIPALRPALWHNVAESVNGEDDDGNGFVDDVFGFNFEYQSGYILDDGSLNHGTICASIIAGRPTPEKPLVTGVAPRAAIMPLNGMGYLKAYEYALANGADVLSMSYMWVNMELGQYRGLFRTAAEHLSAGGVLPVGGAGNFAKSAPPGKQICLPKDIPCVVAVGGVGEDSNRLEFSSQGPCTWAGIRFYDDFPETKPLLKPDLVAPAAGFPCWSKATTLAPQWKVAWKGDGPDALVTGPAGNSFAGPHVAGVAALVFSANPELNAWQVKRIMETTAKDLGEPGPDTQHGAGLLQALEAVRAAKQH